MEVYFHVGLNESLNVLSGFHLNQFEKLLLILTHDWDEAYIHTELQHIDLFDIFGGFVQGVFRWINTGKTNHLCVRPLSARYSRPFEITLNLPHLQFNFKLLKREYVQMCFSILKRSNLTKSQTQHILFAETAVSAQ